MNILTPEQYINKQILEFPALYAGNESSLELATFSILDQLLNVLGNGYNTNEKLLRELTIPENFNFRKVPQEYFEQPIWLGTVYGGETISVLESDKPLHSLVYKWTEITRPLAEWKPYPNFKKECSTVYTSPIFLTFGNSWIEIAIKYYTQCQHHYMVTAYPETEKQHRLRFIHDTIIMLNRHLTS